MQFVEPRKSFSLRLQNKLFALVAEAVQNTGMSTNIASQLRLAADIIETGHPYEVKINDHWFPTINQPNPAELLANGNEIRLVLATPPDSRLLHNPDNLTAEQVGAGWRLAMEGEMMSEAGAQWWKGMGWVKSDGGYILTGNTCRLPLSTPWPEAEKPDPYAEWVDLEPEDVPPFSVIRKRGEAQTWHWRLISHVDAVKMTCANRGYPWSEVRDTHEINRSLAETGKWDETAWEPCRKKLKP